MIMKLKPIEHDELNIIKPHKDKSPGIWLIEVKVKQPKNAQI